MSKIFWDDEFEWLQMESLTNIEAMMLTVEEEVKREELLAQFLGVYIGRYVEIEDSVITSSSATLEEALLRGKGGEVQFVVDPGRSFLPVAPVGIIPMGFTRPKVAKKAA